MQTLTRIGIAVLCVVLASGCFKFEQKTTIESDGSGTHAIEIGISKQVLAMAQQGGENPLDEMESDLGDLPEEWNARVEQWSDAQFSGVRVIVDFENLEMAAEQLEEIMRSGGEDMGPNQEPLIRDLEIEVNDDGDIRLTATAGNAMAEADKEQLQMMRAMFGDIHIGWTVELPTLESFTDTANAERNGNAVSYRFEMGEAYELEITGNMEGPGNPDEPGIDPVVEPASDFEANPGHLVGEWHVDMENLPQQLLNMLPEEALTAFAGMTLTFDGTSVEMAMQGGSESHDYMVAESDGNVLTLESDGRTMIVTFTDADTCTIMETGDPVALPFVRATDDEDGDE